MKVHAVLLYLSGISMPRSAFLLRVSVQSVLNWLYLRIARRRASRWLYFV